MVQHLRVASWYGADRLEVAAAGGGPTTVLTPAQPEAALSLPLSDITWRVTRSAPGPWRDPEVELALEGPESEVPTVPADTVAVHWSDLDAALQQAAGLGLAAVLPSVEDEAGTALRAQVLQAEAGPYLALSAPGIGPVEGIPLVAEGPDRWRFHHRRENLEVAGTVVRTAGGLTLSLESGAVTVQEGTLPLSPTSLSLEWVR